jgi:hypothetical protein
MPYTPFRRVAEAITGTHNITEALELQPMGSPEPPRNTIPVIISLANCRLPGKFATPHFILAITNQPVSTGNLLFSRERNSTFKILRVENTYGSMYHCHVLIEQGLRISYSHLIIHHSDFTPTWTEWFIFITRRLYTTSPATAQK